MTTVTADRAQRPSSHTPGLDNETLLGWLRDMQLIREFESRTAQAYQQAKIGGFCHVYTGQEALVVGTFAAVRKDDPVVTAYRDHGHALARGMSPEACMAEMFGKISGCAKGKGGSMHMFDRPNELYGGHGIVGAQVSLGTGLAFSNWYRENDNVAVTYFGEGASNQGQVYESMNLAALFKLPCIFVIENNKYGMGTSVERASASRDLSQNGAAWGIPGEQVNGMDVIAVREAGERAVAHCRAGKGPYLLEMKTYRYRGHSMSDPAKYRTREEVQKMRETSDCIETARKLLIDQFAVTEAELKVIDDEVKAIVQDSADFAQQSPEPPESELWTDVLVEAR